jgi:eukaryotic-like serine/threonine-protein kinase
MSQRSEHWARVKQVLNLALEANPGDRAQVVRDACAGSSVLETDVESLLAYASETGKLDECLHQTVRDVTWNEGVSWRIGPYRVERVLGSGGMGTVYLGVRDDDQLPARVALKVIHAGTSEALLERFGRERRILAGLIHPYIARLLDAGKLADGRPYFVMEYVEGQTIDEYAASHQPAVLELFLKVCSAIQFAHQNLVIHRDLKPSNILVTPSGEPRLLDFGIAKLLADDDQSAPGEVTQPLERILTPTAASPEQVSGEAVTLASDVYSLGVLLYRLLTGVSPYAGAKEFSVDPAHAIREYVPPLASACEHLTKAVRTSLRGDLDNILRKALDKDPRLRYATAHEFAADIERHLKNMPIEARPASFSYRAAKFIRRNRLGVIAAGLVFLAVTSGLAGTALYAHRAHVEQLRAQHQLSALRKLMQSILFEFDDAIRNVPGSSAAQELVVRRAVEYLDQVASEADDDPELLNGLADAYNHVADITGRFRVNREASAPERAVENALKALAIRRRLFALNPADEKARINLEDMIWNTGARYENLGDFQRSRQFFQEHLRLCEEGLRRGNSSQERYGLGTSFTANGSVERELGLYAEALEDQHRGLEARESILEGEPASARAQRVVGISHEYIGYTLSSQENYGAAAQEHRKALAVFESIVKSDPHNVGTQRLLAVAQENVCESLALSGSAQEAVPHCFTAVALYEALVAADLKDIQASDDLASGESTFSVALDLSHSPQAALEHQQKARKLFASAIARDPADRDMAQFNSMSLMELAKLRRQLHIPGAQAAAAEAVADLRKLAVRYPQSREISRTLDRAEKLSISLR